MKRFTVMLFLFLSLFVDITGAIHAQVVPPDAEVTIVGGGGDEYDVITTEMETGGGMDDFGIVYSKSGDLTITLKDVYITDNLEVITLALGTSASASNHVSSESVFINGEHRLGGGSAGEGIGEPYEQTVTLVFYGGLPDARLGVKWDRLRISFDDLIFASYEGTDSAYFGLTEGYNWSFVFHNPDFSGYDRVDLAPTVDEKGIHSYGSVVTIELTGFSNGGDLNFDLIQKSDLLNQYGSQNAVWINGIPQGDGSSISPNWEENPDKAETQFVQTDHFLYRKGEAIDPESLAVWAQGITVELNCGGTPISWTRSLREEHFPMKIVQFYP